MPIRNATTSRSTNGGAYQPPSAAHPHGMVAAAPLNLYHAQNIAPRSSEHGGGFQTTSTAATSSAYGAVPSVSGGYPSSKLRHHPVDSLSSGDMIVSATSLSVNDAFDELTALVSPSATMPMDDIRTINMAFQNAHNIYENHSILAAGATIDPIVVKQFVEMVSSLKNSFFIKDIL